MHGAPKLLIAAALLASLGCGFRTGLDRTDGAIPEELDFGSVECGENALDDSRSLTVSAATSGLEWSASIEGPFTIVGETHGRLEAGEATTLVIAPTAVRSPHAGDSVSGILHLRTGVVEREVTLRATTKGTELDMPSTLDFAESATNVVREVAVKNTGARPVTIRLGDPSTPEFRLIEPLGPDGYVHLLPGATGAAKVEFNPLSNGEVKATVPLVVEGGVCGKTPLLLELRGVARVGPIKVTASALDFGIVDCGMLSPTRTFDVVNLTSAAVHFNIATAGAPAIVYPANGVLQSGDTATVLVTMAPHRAASFPPTKLLLTTDAAKDSLHAIDLVETPRGAVLDFGTSPTMGKLRVGPATGFLSVINSGTSPVTLMQTGGTPLVTTLPVGSSVLPISLMVDNVSLGFEWTRIFNWDVVAGAACQDQVAVSAKYQSFERARAVSTADGIVCVATASGYYCEGATNTWGLGPSPGQFKTTHMDVFAPPAGGYRIFAGKDGLCTDDWCYFAAGSSTLAKKFSATAASTSGPFVACGTSLCVGTNSFGAWGDPNIGSQVLLEPSLAFNGYAQVEISIVGSIGFALQNGSVLAAGIKSGGNLGPTSHPDGLVTPYALLDAIIDARTVSAFTSPSGGACITHQTGAITCWDTTHPAADVPGITDAATVRAQGVDRFCYQRTGDGKIVCNDSGPLTTVTGIAYPISSWSSDSTSVWVGEADGRVTRIRPLPMIHMTGFEPP